MRQVVLGAVIAFAVTVAVFSFLSPKSAPEPQPVAAPQAVASGDAGIALEPPIVREMSIKRGALAFERLQRLELLSDDAGLPDDATP